MVMMLWHCVSTATNGWKKCNVSCFEEFVYIWVSCLFTFKSAVCLQLYFLFIFQLFAYILLQNQAKYRLGYSEFLSCLPACLPLSQLFVHIWVSCLFTFLPGITLGQKPTFYPENYQELDVWKCEFCEKWGFKIVNYVKNDIFKNVNFVKSEFSKCDFLDKLRIFAPVYLLTLI